MGRKKKKKFHRPKLDKNSLEYQEALFYADKMQLLKNSHYEYYNKILGSQIFKITDLNELHAQIERRFAK